MNLKKYIFNKQTNKKLKEIQFMNRHTNIYLCVYNMFMGLSDLANGYGTTMVMLESYYSRPLLPFFIIKKIYYLSVLLELNGKD